MRVTGRCGGPTNLDAVGDPHPEVALFGGLECPCYKPNRRPRLVPEELDGPRNWICRHVEEEPFARVTPT